MAAARFSLVLVVGEAGAQKGVVVISFVFWVFL
jgi:KaiC/GvpD/RAD55 family RecA-like ATPase